MASFKQHSAPVTSVEWNPVDSSVFAASGADDVVSQWDLSVESCDVGEQAEGLNNYHHSYCSFTRARKK